MLNIDTSVYIDENEHSIPFYFDRKNECIKCGGKNTLRFIDKFDRETRDQIRPFDHIRCIKCNSEYSIIWNKDDNSAKMYPSINTKNICRDFRNLVNNG